MQAEFDRRLGESIARWVMIACRRPALTVVSMGLLTVLSLGYAVGHLGIDGDAESLFSADLPFKLNQRRYYEAFPRQRDTIFVVVDAATPERAGLATQQLADRLSADPAHFRGVYFPGGGAFFEQHAYLYLDLDSLDALADRLAQAQPYLAELSRDGSLRGLASILARGARAARDGDVPEEQLVSIYKRVAEALDALKEHRPYYLSWAEVLAAHSFEGNPRRRYLLVEPVLDAERFQPAERALVALRHHVAELRAGGDVRIRITGEAALSYDELEVVRTQAITAGVASFALVAFILLFALRSIRLVVATLVTLLVGLVLTGGFTAITIGHLNLISVSFAVLFIGLGVDFGIHVSMRYRELMSHGRLHEEALRETASDVGTSLVLCALTTAIGFFAFVPTAFVGVAELGLISGAGMLISLFCTLTLLPALLSLPPVPESHGRHDIRAWTGVLVELPVRFPRSVRILALALGAASIVFLPEARFDNNPLNVRDPSSESVTTLADLLADGQASPWSLNALAPNLASAEALAERLRALDEVERAITIADFVPTDQDAKLGIIGDVALFMEPLPGRDDDAPQVTASDQISALRTLDRELRVTIANHAASATLRSSASALHARLGDYLSRVESSVDPLASLGALQESLLGSLPEQLRILASSLNATRVGLDQLPAPLREQMLSKSGAVRVQIFPRGDLQDHAALARFVDAVRAVDPDVAGSAAEIVASGRTVVKALREALGSALIVVTLLMLVLWRRVTDTALVLIPLALASALTVASAVLLGIPFNFADVIVLPLLLGIGVDAGIHLVHRARASEEAGANLLRTSTARAVSYSALTTIASFASLGFATHRGLATLGQLLTLGVTFTLLCNLIVLPALISLRPRRPGPVAAPPPASS
jgi:uncharacterized protein